MISSARRASAESHRACPRLGSCNLDLPLRWAERLLITPRLHRVHRVPANTNRYLGHRACRSQEARTFVLSRGIPPWSYRRRIAQLVRLRLAERILLLANTHLASGDARARRQQARRLLAVLQPGTLAVGDLNDRPSSDVLRLLTGAGLRDTWAALHPDAPEADGATHWRPRDPDERPTRRLDYVLAPQGDHLLAATAPTAADSDLGAYRRLSDHLPLTTRLE
ncbi:MAG TPA: endonuclease/exonuclease/phosphatase family protein [Jiangellaceae bacterium]|nr:endonuclease/exonuclease/phosphatase family protein [Jiangellaceae bacterium]